MKHRAAIAVSLLSLAAGVGIMGAHQQGTTRREPQFENDQVRVWKSIIMPKQPLTFHRHDHGRVLIALTDGQLKVVNPEGEQVGFYDWKKGRAYWLEADPPGKLHADLNETEQPVEVIVVEVKQAR